METTCGSCWGTGRVTCPDCGGRRHRGRLTGNMEFEMNTCLVCGGRGEVRCDFCHGRGTIYSPDPDKGPTKTKSSDPLEGVWTTSGGSYKFIKENDHYKVIENSAIGKSGEGTAKLEGNIVSLFMKTVFLGSFNVSLQLNGNRLDGFMKIFGLPVPFILYR